MRQIKNIFILYSTLNTQPLIHRHKNNKYLYNSLFKFKKKKKNLSNVQLMMLMLLMSVQICKSVQILENTMNTFVSSTILLSTTSNAVFENTMNNIIANTQNRLSIG